MRAPVLHVIPFLWSGAGGFVTRLCEAQRRERRVAIVTTGNRGDHPDWPTYRARLRRAGVEHHTIDFFHRSEEHFWSGCAELGEVIRALKPGVIHAHAGVPCCGAVIGRAMSGHRARVIGQMYSWGPDRPEWMNRQDTWGLAQADRVICLARAYWDLLVRYGVPRRKLVYLPVGLPLDELPWRGQTRTPRVDRSPVIGFIGRIEPRKGQLDLVEAFVRVRRKYPKARLELVGPAGDEGYAKRVREAIVDRELRGAVTLAGEVRDVTKYLRKWDLFVSMSADEGQGLAVLEAMAIGVPVVARSVAGISDFLSDERTGLVVSGSSAPAAARAILRALESPTSLAAIARRARRLVERRYAWERTVTALERLYWA